VQKAIVLILKTYLTEATRIDKIDEERTTDATPSISDDLIVQLIILNFSEIISIKLVKRYVSIPFKSGLRLIGFTNAENKPA